MTADLLERRRRRRVLAGQAPVSALLLGAAALFWGAAHDLASAGVGWDAWSVAMRIAAIASGTAALAPYTWPGLTVQAQRLLGWGGLVIASTVTLGAIVVLDLAAALGCQLALCGLGLNEHAGHRHALRWLLACLALLVAAVATYYGVVEPRRLAD